MRMRGRPRRGLIVLLLVMVASAMGTGCANDPAELFTATYELPPFNFNPMGQQGDESNSYRVNIPRPPGDIAVKKITWKLVDGAGNEIPATNHDIHFHHVVLFNSGHPDMACGGNRGGLGGRFAAPGGERTPLELANGFAYFTNRSDVWSAQWHLMNLTQEPQRNVRVQYTVTWATDRSTLARATPYWLDSAGCGAGSFNVPGGGEPAVFTRTRYFTVAQSGVIRAVRSHMHDGGIDVTLSRANGQVICKGTPTYHTPEPGHDHGMDHGDGHGHGGAARIVAIPLCKDLDIRVATGERLTQVVRYDNRTAQTGAMGSNLMYIVEDPRPPTTTTTRPPTTRPPSTRPPSTRPPTTRPTTTTAAPTTVGPTTTSGHDHGDHDHGGA